MRRTLSIVAVLIFMQALLLAVFFIKRDDPASFDSEIDNRVAPELVFMRREGTESRLSLLRGRPVLVHFWATWCPPCRTELPGILQLAEIRGLGVIAVSLDGSWEDVERFIDVTAESPIVLATTASASDAFRVPRLPETLLVDGGGRIRLRFAGARDWSSDEAQRVVSDFVAAHSNREVRMKQEAR